MIKNRHETILNVLPVTVANAAVVEEFSELVLMLGESLRTTEAVGQYLRSLVITAEAEVKYGVPELDTVVAKKKKQNTFCFLHT